MLTLHAAGQKHPWPARRARRRDGAILLVVLALLALFAVIGLSFVLYAESEANAARMHLQAEATPIVVPPDPITVVNTLLAQMIQGDGNTGSALYGHDLSRLMYGGLGGQTPYDGVGTFSQPINSTSVPLLLAAGIPPVGPGSFDRKDAINYATWGSPYGNSNFTTVVDPERALLVAADPIAPGRLRVWDPVSMSLVDSTSGPTPTPVIVPKNAPYTYPDRNNALLAMLDPRSGQVRVVSGHREGLFGPMGGANPAARFDNPNWYNVPGHFMTLRPRPFDHLTPSERAALPPGLNGPLATLTPGQVNALAVLAQQGRLGEFPFPVVNTDGTVTGDVQNLPYSTANNNLVANGTAVTTGQQRMDAVWMYPNLPVFEYKGKRVAVMVAPTLVPLDGVPNVNAAGNLVVAGGTHGSHSGFGPHEINLGKVLENTSSGTAVSYAQQIIQKRYGGSNLPPAPRELPSPGDVGHLTTAAAGPAWPYYPNFPNNGVAVSAQAFHPTAPGLSRTPNNMNRSAFTVGQSRPPEAMAVNWSGQTTAAYNLPGAAALRFQSGPTFTYNNSSFTPADPMSGTPPNPTGDTLSHPLLWNPYHRPDFSVGVPSVGFPGLFPITDLKSMRARYSDRRGRLAGETVLASNNPPLYTASNLLGVDGPVFVGNHARSRLTTISNSRAAGGLAPNFFGDPNVKLKLLPGTSVPQLANTTGTAANPQFNLGTLVTPLAQGGLNDATYTGASDAIDDGTFSHAASGLSNKRARLGPIDLNRPLPDYRGPTPTMPTLTPAEVGANESAARLARQQLAHDIFIRLAVSTGATVRWDTGTNRYALPVPAMGGTGYTINVPGMNPPNQQVTAEEYSALRWLAQYAANVVDALDSDDVSTPFVWNPLDPTTPTTSQAATNYDTTPDATTNNQSPMANRMVFGVEKPRVVLNEVYAEMTVAEADAAKNHATEPFQARFYVEMLNPSSYDATSPQPQSVPLDYPALPLVKPYRIEVFDNSLDTRQQLTDPGRAEVNITGAVTPAAGTNLRRIQMPLTGLTTAVGPNGIYDDTGSPIADPAHTLEPNSGAFEPVTAPNLQRKGFGLIGPGSTSGATTALTADDKAYAPNVTAAPFNMMIQMPLIPPAPTIADTDKQDERQMAYFMPLESKMALDTGGPTKRQIDKRHAVVLQRLANPYMQEGVNNPYLTVDVAYDVRVYDAVRAGKRPGMAATDESRNPMPALASRHAVGRVQPFAGSPFDGTGTTPRVAQDPYTVTKAQSLTVRQQPTPAGASVQQTFMRHNAQSPGFGAAPATPGDATLDFPFEWMVHLDRRVINAEELLHVAAVKPHELTTQFARPNAGGGRSGVQLHSLRRWVDPAPNPGLSAAESAADSAIVAASPLYRALDLLMPKPWGHDMPLAGRVPGRINVNMIWDKKVFEALLDQNGGSSFTQAEVDQMWLDFVASRSPRLLTATTGADSTVGNTADEAPGAPGTLDRPFKGLGAPRFDAGANRIVASGVGDTLFRDGPDPGGTTRKLLFSRPQTSRLTGTLPPGDQPVHPYRDNEPLRKILNNVTTTSDTFLLVFTVGYFEVRNSGEITPTNPVILGKEVFDRVPGDLRAKFAAVIDRTHLAQVTPAADPVTGVANAPWVMELQSGVTDVSAGSNTAAQVLLPPKGVDRSGWSGASPDMIPLPVANSELFYNVNRPAPGLTNEYLITPRYGRFPNSMVIPDNNPGSFQEIVLTGKYEGRDFTLSARVDQAPVTDVSVGTQFYIGTGRKRALVQLYFSPADPAQQWSYNPITGQTRIFMQVLPPAAGDTEPRDTGPQTYAPGTILSSVVFGSPLAPAVDIRTASPTVPFFTRLTP